MTIEADFEHVRGGTEERGLTTFPFTQSSLMSLLECSVISATTEADKALMLGFSNGDSLRISKRPGYESYRMESRSMG